MAPGDGVETMAADETDNATIDFGGSEGNGARDDGELDAHEEDVLSPGRPQQDDDRDEHADGAKGNKTDDDDGEPLRSGSGGDTDTVTNHDKDGFVNGDGDKEMEGGEADEDDNNDNNDDSTTRNGKKKKDCEELNGNIGGDGEGREEGAGDGDDTGTDAMGTVDGVDGEGDERGDGTSPSPIPTTSIKLFVGHLPKDFQPEQVKALFDKFGKITDVYVLRHFKTRQSKGCAKVTFERKRDGLRAIAEMDEALTLPGALKPLSVTHALEQPTVASRRQQQQQQQSQQSRQHQKSQHRHMGMVYGSSHKNGRDPIRGREGRSHSPRWSGGRGTSSVRSSAGNGSGGGGGSGVSSRDRDRDRVRDRRDDRGEDRDRERGSRDTGRVPYSYSRSGYSSAQVPGGRDHSRDRNRDRDRDSDRDRDRDRDRDERLRAGSPHSTAGGRSHRSHPENHHHHHNHHDPHHHHHHLDQLKNHHHPGSRNNNDTVNGNGNGNGNGDSRSGYSYPGRGRSRERARERGPYYSQPSSQPEAAPYASDARARGRSEYRLFVMNVPLTCEEAHLFQVFNYYGKTLSATVLRHSNGESKGTAWVRYGSYDEAQAAQSALDNSNYVMPGGSRSLRVEFESDRNSNAANLRVPPPPPPPRPHAGTKSSDNRDARMSRRRSRHRSRRRNPNAAMRDGGSGSGGGEYTPHSHAVSSPARPLSTSSSLSSSALKRKYRAPATNDRVGNNGDGRGNSGGGGCGNSGGGGCGNSGTGTSNGIGGGRDEARLYISGIPYTSTDVDIRRMFERFGTVVSSHVLKDQRDRSKGSGFIVFRSMGEAQRAIDSMNGSLEMDPARALRVDFAKPKGNKSSNDSRDRVVRYSAPSAASSSSSAKRHAKY